MLLLLFFVWVHSSPIMDIDAVPVNTCESLFPGLTVTQFGGYCYGIRTMQTTFAEAEEYCRETYWGNLASIHSEEENAAVFALLKQGMLEDPRMKSAWLGGKDVESEGTFKWNDGTYWDYTNWHPSNPSNSWYIEDFVHMIGDGLWNDLANDWPSWEVGTICKTPLCEGDYEGGYIAGKRQCGFGDEGFKGDYTEGDHGVDEIDIILEEMETEFEEEAKFWENELDKAFNAKKKSYEDVVDAELLYIDYMDARVSKEDLYNDARFKEEKAHDDLLEAITAYNLAVQAHMDAHEYYVEKIDFLNYELFIIQQIRELLGANIGYIPVQIVLEILPYDATYDGWTTEYPNRPESTFDHEDQRFGQRRRRRRKRATQKKRKRRRRRRRRRRR